MSDKTEKIADEISSWLQSAVLDSASCEEEADNMYNCADTLANLIGDKAFDQVTMLGHEYGDKQFNIIFNEILDNLSRSTHQALKDACKILRKT